MLGLRIWDRGFRVQGMGFGRKALTQPEPYSWSKKLQQLFTKVSKLCFCTANLSPEP